MIKYFKLIWFLQQGFAYLNVLIPNSYFCKFWLQGLWFCIRKLKKLVQWRRSGCKAIVHFKYRNYRTVKKCIFIWHLISALLLSNSYWIINWIEFLYFDSNICLVFTFIKKWICETSLDYGMVQSSQFRPWFGPI